jgi:hypothetical protein
MKLSYCITVSVLAFSTVNVATTSTAFGQSNTEAESATSRDAVLAAKKLVDEAMGLYAQADWEGARVLLLKALAVKPHRAILGNLAEIEMKTGRYVEAAGHLKQLIADLPPEPRKRVEAAEAQLAECLQHVATLHVTVNVTGASVRLNDEVIGFTPLKGEAFVAPGTVRISVDHPDYLQMTRSLEATAGQVQDVALEMNPKPAPVPAAPVAVSTTDPDKDAQSTSIRTRNILTISGALLSVAGTTVGTILWLNANSDEKEAASLGDSLAAANPEVNADSVCYGSNVKDPAGCAKLQSLLVHRNRQNKFAVGSFVGAGVTAVAATLTYLLWPTKARRQAVGKSGKAAVALEPWASRDTQGLQVLGTF